MQCNQFGLSIPPHLSTSWENIIAMRCEDNVLIVTLEGGKEIQVPSLTAEQINDVFSTHLKSLEKSKETTESTQSPAPSMPFSFGIGPAMEGMAPAMQHNPDHKNLPPLPDDALEKISAIARIVTPEELDQMPPAEPHCNCMYCQIARAVQGDAPQVEPEQIEEEVSDEDLTFRNWDIAKKGDNLYDVSNPLDKSEHYQVFLGKPVGCTCGEEGCEHILAVLQS